MSIIEPNDEHQYPTDELCVLCGQLAADVQEPVVVWMSSTPGGAAHFDYWHAGCVGSFVLRLARDAWQVETDRNDGRIEFRRRS